MALNNMEDPGVTSGRSIPVGCEMQSSAEYAAFVNATFGHGFEIEDFATAAMAHPGRVAVPASLNAASEVATRVGEPAMEWMLARGFHVPEELDETWAYLRQLGQRRAQLITAETVSMHRIEDFLAVAWPAVTGTCAQPLKSVTWLAALEVVTSQCGGRSTRLADVGLEAFTAAVRAVVPDWGGKRDCRPVAARVFDALTSAEGVVAWSRRGLLRRVADELGDLQRTRTQLRGVEADMVDVLDELGLFRLADIPALTAVGMAAILAEVGDLHQYDSSSSLVMQAGMSPSENASGDFSGDAHISRCGRPSLRRTVLHAVGPMLQFNPVMAAKYQAMTQAVDPAGAPVGPTSSASAVVAAARARRAEARVACAASLLHWIHFMVVHETSWSAAVAASKPGTSRPADAAGPAPISHRSGPSACPVEQARHHPIGCLLSLVGLDR